MKNGVVVLLVMMSAACRGPAVDDRRPTPVLRVCADPNNLPFSNDRGEGFENALADMYAQDLGARVEYTWWAQRRGFFRQTLSAGACDVVMGVPTELEMAATSRPYYRSTYVFVWRRDRHLGITSLDDPRLRGLRVGVQMIGDDFSNSPPAHALSSRGAIRNIVGYSVLGDYSQPNPPARIVEAVERGDVDIAVVWGPLAGYFAKHASTPLDVAAVTPQRDGLWPFVFDISIGFRRGDAERKRSVNEFLTRRQADIDALLDRYGVPRVAPEKPS